MMHKDEPEYLSPEEVGARLRASKWTVRRWIESGKVPAIRVGRRWLIPKDAVDRMQADIDSITYVISRGPAPIYSIFEGVVIREIDPDQLTASVVEILHAGGIPLDNHESCRDAVHRIIGGQEKAPRAFWSILSRGIEAIRTKTKC